MLAARAEDVYKSGLWIVRDGLLKTTPLLLWKGPILAMLSSFSSKSIRLKTCHLQETVSYSLIWYKLIILSSSKLARRLLLYSRRNVPSIGPMHKLITIYFALRKVLARDTNLLCLRYALFVTLVQRLLIAAIPSANICMDTTLGLHVVETDGRALCAVGVSGFLAGVVGLAAAGDRKSVV